MANPQLESLLLSRLDTLPYCPMSPILSGVLERLEQPDADLQELTRLISSDASLSERLMVTAAQHTGRRMHSIEQTVRLVGFKMLKSLLSNLASADGRSPKLDRITHRVMNDQLLCHAELVGICSHLIAHDVGYGHLPEAYTAGLLHDMGRALLTTFAYDELSAAMRISPAKAANAYCAEDTALGLDHAYIGALALEHWGMPPAIVEAVAYHHRPKEAPKYPRLAKIVHLADMVMNCLQARLPIGISLFPIDREVLASMALTKERAQHLGEHAMALYGRSRERSLSPA